MRTALFLSLSALLAGCAPLDDLSPGECGNGVLDDREDCDGLGVGDSKCMGEGDVAPCRLSCDEAGGCPEGFGCGADDVCRRPSGSFEGIPFVQRPSQALELSAARFDSDRTEEIVALEPGRMRIHFVGESGDVQETLIGTLSRPAIGKLGAQTAVEGSMNDAPGGGVDATDDLMLSLGFGLGAVLAEGDGTFKAKTYQSFTFDTVEAAFVEDVLPIAIDALPTFGEEQTGDETAALIGILDQQDMYSMTGVLVDFGPSGSELVFTIPDTNPSFLAGSPLIANFDADPCEEIAFPGWFKSTLTIYKVCKAVPGEPNQKTWLRTPNHEDAKLVDIALDGEIQGPAFARDVNRDGKMDVVVTLLLAGAYQLHCAYGLGDGKFSSVAPPFDFLGKPDAAGFVGYPPAGPPLDVGHLNDDAYLDLVDAFGVKLGKQGDIYAPVEFNEAFESSRVWTEAHIADMNADERPDVVAGGGNAADVDVVLGTGTDLFNEMTIATDGTVRDLTIGDFDGDLVNDVVFSDDLGMNETLLVISYGQTSGGPESIREVGRFSTLARIVVGDVHTFGKDAINDLGVLSYNDEGVRGFSFFPGASSRQMLAPYLLSDQKEKIHLPVLSAIGHARASDAGNEQSFRDLAVLAIESAALMPPKDPTPIDRISLYSNAFRMWLLNLREDADLGSPENKPQPCPLFGAVVYPGLELATSLIFTDTQPGRVFLATPFVTYGTDKSSVEVASALVEVFFEAGGSCAMGRPVLSEPGEMLLRVRAVDLDEKGGPEIVAVRRKYDAQCVNELFYSAFDPTSVPEACVGAVNEGSLGPLTPELSDVVIFWDGNLGSEPTVVRPAEIADYPLLSDFAVGQAHPEAGVELLVSDELRGVYRYRVAPGSQELTGEEWLPVAYSGVSSALLADADGDGVKDLVVRSSSLQVFRGIPEWDDGAVSVSPADGAK